MLVGDGVRRHPTQLYEIAAVLPLGWALQRARFATPGAAFKRSATAFGGYLGNSLFNEFRPDLTRIGNRILGR